MLFAPLADHTVWYMAAAQGEALIVAQWPAAGSARCAASVSAWEALQGVVRAVRNARAEYNVEVGKKIAATLVVSDAAEREALASELPVICLLAKLEPSQVAVVSEAPASAQGTGQAVSLVVKEGVQVLIPMAGLFDVVKELARLNKQRTKLQKDLDGINSRLSNPKFMEKASPEYVAEAKAQQAEAAEKLALVDAKVAQVSAMK